jgi:FKBP-type peptidyl-prolyl cis-trans isomerase
MVLIAIFKLMIKKMIDFGKITSKKLWKTVYVFLFVLLIQGCMSLDEDHSDRELLEYIKTHNFNMQKTTHGFYLEVINSSGSNIKPAPGDYIGIYYRIKLLNGNHIDSLTQGKTMRFRHLFTNLYPQGIDLGISYMGKGDSYRFLIPSYLAYHDLRIDTLMPAYSNIIAEVTLVDITDSIGQVQYELGRNAEDYGQNDGYIENSGVFYRTVENGQGTVPTADEQVKITYSRSLLNGKQVDNGTETITINNLPFKLKGIREGLQMMNKGETAVFIVPSHKAYWDKAILKNSTQKSTAKVIPENFAPEILIPPFSSVLYEVKMHE